MTTTAASASTPSGRLELTWTNKHQRLLAHEDGSYEWTAASDHRVAEVRLLHDVTTVGEVAAEPYRARDNLLIHGDALHALTSLSSIPEFRDEYLGKIKLVYIDPPFNTGQAFEQYDDALQHSVWLTMMRDRLRQAHGLLADDGCLWLHCDDAEQAYAKAVLDEVFGRENFAGTIIWQKADTPRMDATKFSSSHDYLICYGKSARWQPKQREFVPDLAGYPYTSEDGRRYSSLTLRKWGHNSQREDRPTMWYPIEHDGREFFPIKPDGTEGYWRWDRRRYEENKHRVEWLDKGNGLQPYVVTFAPPNSSRPFETLWTNYEVGHNREAKAHLKTMFPVKTFATPKPERLLARIINISTKPDDVVLDFFAGSGTTAAVAHKMGRRWVAVERSHVNVQQFIEPRLRLVVDGRDPGGASSVERPLVDALPGDLKPGSAREAARVLRVLAEAGALEEVEGLEANQVLGLTKALRNADRVRREVIWSGGGGFRVLTVAASMFEVVQGRVVLADWATGGALSEAVAAQTSFAFEDDAPFSGRKGRQRLAVIDGLVNEDVLRLILPWLAEGELLTVYGTAVDPTCKSVLSELRRGSSVKRIPQSVLDDYRRAGPRSDGLDWPSVVVQADKSTTDAATGVGAAR